MSVEHPATPWSSFSPAELFGTLLWAMMEVSQSGSASKVWDTFLLNLSKKEFPLMPTPFSTEPKERENNYASLYRDISQILTTLGIPSNLLGYEYLRYSIFIAVQDRESLCGMTKLLYPAVAKKYQVSVSSVERAMRYAIEISCTRGDSKAIHSFFGNTMSPASGKPANSEFISKIADTLRTGYSSASFTL